MLVLKNEKSPKMAICLQLHVSKWKVFFFMFNLNDFVCNYLFILDKAQKCLLK